MIPDLKFLVNHGVTIMLFTSGIFYAVEDLPVHLQEYLYLNPLANILAAYRDVLLHGQMPDFSRLLSSLWTGGLLMGFGLWLIFKLDRKYPKIVRMRGI